MQRNTASVRINELCLQMGSLLLQNGAESALIESTTRRLGLALKAEQVEVIALANAIIVTTRVADEMETAVVRARDHNVNMRVVTEVQRIMLEIESAPLSLEDAKARLSSVRADRYPEWLTVLAIGFSCACFARLAKADFPGCAVTFVASSGAMATRFKLAARRFSPILTFGVTAFVATALAGQAMLYKWTESPQIAMASSCLLLVPGVPLINGVSDIV